ncbi:ABC transporter ATP-binding protein [Candidatus Bathyarchaeota archaeon]|nr:MAG: ABC transporter ATP-binding protein [Candidatus Bathyarchaeota archaeon]
MSNPSSQGPSILQFQNTVKDYGSKKIGPVDLSIGKGEIVGFLGPNGSGKTTCIRLMLGLIRPSSGNVRVNGYDPISKHVEALNHVAYSPELPNIQTFLTPTELLTLVLHELEFKGDKQDEIRRVLELVGLIEYRDTKVGKLSKGMVQRLSVAQALIGSPELLVLDEPMLGLDPAGSAHFREVFREFAMGGKGTVFMSSHMMNEVESLCTSVLIIHSGRILFRGSSSDVIRKVLDYSVVTVEAQGLPQETINSIKGMPNVSQVTINSQTIEIIIKGHDDIRPALSDLIVKSGARLYTIKTADNMLERAYIEALKKNGVDR